MCNFRVGQKVTMVRQFSPNVAARAALDGTTLPSYGVVYTVRGIEPDGIDGDDYLWLVELTNKPHWSDGIEPNFGSTLFRPVVETKTDISIFKAMLTDQPERVGA